MDLRNLQAEIGVLAQQAVIEGLVDNDTYASKANAYICSWLAEQGIEATEDNVYAVREDFDYYTNTCLEQRA